LVTSGGIDVYERVSYVNTDPGTSITDQVEIRATPSTAAMNCEFNDITNTINTNATLKSQPGSSELAMTTTDTTSGTTALRQQITSSTSHTDTFNSAGGTSTATRNETTGFSSGVNDTHTYSNGGISNNQVKQTQQTTVADLKQYQNTTATTVAFRSDNTCDGIRARYRVQHTDTGGSTTVNHAQTMAVDGVSAIIQQNYNNSAVGARTTTIQTTSAGLGIACDNAVAIGAGGSASINMNNNATISAGTQTFTTTTPTTPGYTLENTSAIAGAHPTLQTAITGHNQVGTSTDYVYQETYVAKNTAGTNITWGGMDVVSRNATAGNEDGIVAFSCAINGVPTKLLEINGSDGTLVGEVNVFQALDLNGQALKSSSGNLNISASGSTGNGIVSIATKNTTGRLEITGDQITSATAGSSSGRHLSIWLPNASGVLTQYKINLFNV
jgi:hypothetical protein